MENLRSLRNLLGENDTARGIKETIEEKLSQYGAFDGVADDIQASEFIYAGVTYTLESGDEVEFYFDLIDEYEGWKSDIDITRIAINGVDNLEDIEE